MLHMLMDSSRDLYELFRYEVTRYYWKKFKLSLSMSFVSLSTSNKCYILASYEYYVWSS
jgi:hypothetical protein